MTPVLNLHRDYTADSFVIYPFLLLKFRIEREHRPNVRIVVIMAFSYFGRKKRIDKKPNVNRYLP